MAIAQLCKCSSIICRKSLLFLIRLRVSLSAFYTMRQVRYVLPGILCQLYNDFTFCSLETKARSVSITTSVLQTAIILDQDQQFFQLIFALVIVPEWIIVDRLHIIVVCRLVLWTFSMLFICNCSCHSFFSNHYLEKTWKY